MRVLSWLGGAAMAALILAPQAQAQTKRFDGNWSVEVVTEQGACDRAYRYAVIVQNGRARYGGPENFNVNGQVQQNGAVSASISRGQDRANVSGRLSGAWAAGPGRPRAGGSARATGMPRSGGDMHTVMAGLVPAIHVLGTTVS